MSCAIGQYKITKDSRNRDVFEVAPQEHYNTFNSTNLRVRFLGLSLFKLPACAPLQIGYRIFDILLGGFYVRGALKAKYAHLTQMKSNPSLIGRAIPYCSIVYEVVKELIVNISKIVLYPLYFLTQEFACLVGLLFPFDARRIFSRMDQIMYLDSRDPYVQAGWIERVSNIAAACMQTKEFRKKKNLFRWARPDLYHPQTTRSLLAQIEREKFLVNGDLETRFNASISQVRKSVLNIGDGAEANQLHKGERQPNAELISILSDLRKINADACHQS